MDVLASDFDGTLFFNEEGGFKSLDILAIEKFQKAGNLFGICTGRPLGGVLRPTANKIKYDFYIVSSGAVILDKDLNILFQKTITFDLVEKIYNRYHNQSQILIQVVGNDDIYVIGRRDLGFEHAKSIDLDQVSKLQVADVSLRFHNDEIKAGIIAKEINSLFGQEIDAFQNRESIDIVSKGCSKGTGIEFLKKYLNIDEIVGIGDSYNDLPMIEKVDISFTFDYAPLVIQNQVDYVVPVLNEAIAILESRK